MSDRFQTVGAKAARRGLAPRVGLIELHAQLHLRAMQSGLCPGTGETAGGIRATFGTDRLRLHMLGAVRRTADVLGIKTAVCLLRRGWFRGQVRSLMLPVLALFAPDLGARDQPPRGSFHRYAVRVVLVLCARSTVTHALEGKTMRQTYVCSQSP